MVFTKEMSEFLVELIKDSKEELFPNTKQKGARATQQRAWEAVRDDFINQYPHSGITLKQIQEKWKNVKQTAKEKNQKL